MLRLSKLTDYAVVVLAEMGREPANWRTAPQLSSASGAPEPTVAKVLKLLCQANLVASQRGARGGYRLSLPLARVTIADVIVAIDGPIALAACVDGVQGGCEAEARCPVRGRWDPVNHAIRAALAGITVGDLLCPAVGSTTAQPNADPTGPWRRQQAVPSRETLEPLAAE